MSEDPVTLVDRLKEGGALDRAGFIFVAVTGSVAIIAAKYVGVPAVWVAMGAASAILIYALLIARYGTGRIRSDQAGDNCYYLGLIFTLVSLAFTIFTFDPANTATTIVQGFGVALASTIVGLIARVFFSQLRVDLIETEDSARLELTSAAGQLSAELNQVIAHMADFNIRSMQILGEVRDAATESVTSASTEAISSLQRIAAIATQSLETQSTETMARTKRLTTATDRMVVSLEGHGASLDSLSSSNDKIANSLSAISTLADGSNAAMSSLVSRSAEMSDLQTSMHGAIAKLQSATNQMAGTIVAFANAADTADLSIQARLDKIEQAPKKTITAAASAISEASETILAEARKLAEVQAEVIGSVRGQIGDHAEIAHRYNIALEDQLAKSRENVAKVHDALAQMTGDLARHVEVRTAG